jgi:hypothetical protein
MALLDAAGNDPRPAPVVGDENPRQLRDDPPF